MANRKNYNQRSKRKNKNSYSGSEIKRLAYLMGIVNRGLNNPDSAVTESFNRGLKEPSKTKKKTLL